MRARDRALRLLSRAAIWHFDSGWIQYCLVSEFNSCVAFFCDVGGAKMSLYLKRLSLTNARLEIFTRTEADLQAQFLELMKLRGQVRTAQLSADLQRVERASEPAPVVIAAAA